MILNRHKFDWETFNTNIIKIIYSSRVYELRFFNDYGSKIILKCNRPISRKEETRDGETCANWQYIDSFGVKKTNNTEIYTEFYSKKYIFSEVDRLSAQVKLIFNRSGEAS